MRYFGLDAGTENIVFLGDHDCYDAADEAAAKLAGGYDIMMLFTADSAKRLMEQLDKALTETADAL